MAKKLKRITDAKELKGGCMFIPITHDRGRLHMDDVVVICGVPFYDKFYAGYFVRTRYYSSYYKTIIQDDTFLSSNSINGRDPWETYTGLFSFSPGNYKFLKKLVDDKNMKEYRRLFF